MAESDAPKRPRGRPRLPDDERTTVIGVSVPNRTYDAIAKIAHRHGSSLSAVVNHLILQRLDAEKD